MSSLNNKVFGGGQDDVNSVSDGNNKMNNELSHPPHNQQEEAGALALLAMNNSTKPSLPRSCLKSTLSTSTNKGRISWSEVESTVILFDHPHNQLCMSLEQMRINQVEKTCQIGKEIGLELRERDLEALQIEELQFPEDASERNKQVEIERSATNVKRRFLETNKVEKLPPHLEEQYRRCCLGVWHSSGPTGQMLETFIASCADREMVHNWFNKKSLTDPRRRSSVKETANILPSLPKAISEDNTQGQGATAELKIEEEEKNVVDSATAKDRSDNSAAATDTTAKSTSIKLSEKELDDCQLLLGLRGMLKKEDADNEISKLSENQLAFCEQQMNNCSLKTYLVDGVTSDDGQDEEEDGDETPLLSIKETAIVQPPVQDTSTHNDVQHTVEIISPYNEPSSKPKSQKVPTPNASNAENEHINAKQQASTKRYKRKYQPMSSNDTDGENMKQMSTSKRKKPRKSFLFGSQIKRSVEFVPFAGRGQSTKSKTLDGTEPDIPNPEEDLKVPSCNVAADGEDPAALGRADDTAEHRLLQQEAGPTAKSTNPSTPVPAKINDEKGGESLDKCEKRGSTGGNGKGGGSAKSSSDADDKLPVVGKVAPTPTSTPKANDAPTTPGEDIKVSTAGEERGDDKTAKPPQLPQEFNDDEDAEFGAPAPLPSTKNPKDGEAADEDEPIEFENADPLESDEEEESIDGPSNAKALSTSISSERQSVLSWDCGKLSLKKAQGASKDTISIGDLLKPLSQSSLSSDFTHLTSALAYLRQAHPTAGLFLTVFKEGNIPVVITFIVSQGHVPTTLVGYYNKDQGTDEIYSFDDVGYKWVEMNGVESDVQCLVCDKEKSLLPVNSRQNGGCIFALPAANLKLMGSRKQKPRVSSVTYTILDGDNNEQSISWNKSVQPSMDEHISNTLKDHFPRLTLCQNDTEEVKAMNTTRSKQAIKHVKQQLNSAIAEVRSVIKGDYDRFFEAAGYNKEVFDKIGCVKIYPVNHPSPTNLCISDTYFDNMTTDSVIINHSLFDNCTGLLHRVSKRLINRINFKAEAESLDPITIKLCLTLIVDLLHNSRYLDAPEKISVFDIDRILQHMGKDLDDVDCSDECVQKTMHFLITKLHSLLETIDHKPQNVNDFIFNFLFKTSNELVTADNSTKSAKCVRISRANNDMLELCFVGEEETFVSTDPTKLKEFVSLQGIMDLIINLLVQPPGTAITVPAGSRDNDEASSSDSQIEEANCFKQALLCAPDQMLSPSGKRRVKMTFPDHEITRGEVINLLHNSIKTIAIKQLHSKDLMDEALSANAVMIGVFGSGSRKHCIMIDGTDGEYGTIIDPDPNFNKPMWRSTRSMEKLRITSLVELYELKRVEMKDKTRKGAQKRLNLPFVAPNEDDYDKARSICPKELLSVLNKSITDDFLTKEEALNLATDLIVENKSQKSGAPAH